MRGDTKAITSLVLREESAWSLSAAVISSLSFLFTYLLLTSIMLLIIHDLIYASQNIITSLNKIQYILDCYIFQLLTYIPTFFKIMYGNWQQASLEVKHFPGKILRNLIDFLHLCLVHFVKKLDMSEFQLLLQRERNRKSSFSRQRAAGNMAKPTCSTSRNTLRARNILGGV